MNARKDNRIFFMQWLAILALAGTSLVFVVNVNDSTMFKRPILYASAGLLAAVWVSYSLQQMKFQRILSWMDLAVGGHVAISGVSLLNAPNLKLGAIGFADLICLCILYMACTELSRDHGFIRRFLKSFIVISVLASSVAIYQVLSARMFHERESISTFGNVTYFAGFLAPVLAIIAGQILASTNRAYRLLLTLLFVVMIYLLITTESRSGWAGAAAGAVLLIFLIIPSGKTRWIIVGSLLAAGVLIFIAFPEMVQRRLLGIIEVSPTSSIARRFIFYRGAWNAFLASPVFGQGLGNFTLFLPKFRSPDYWMAHAEDIVPHAHNEYLEILSETGCAGFLTFATIVFLCFRSAGKRLKQSSPADRIVLAGFIAALAAILVDNLGSMNLRTVPVVVTFWIILALAHRMSATEAQPVTFSLPPWVRKLHMAPYFIYGALLIWYVPRVSERYRAQRNYLAGNLLRSQQRTTESSLNYKEAVSHDPDFAEARLYLAASLAQENRYEEARRNIDTILMQNPHFPKARFILAISSFGLRDTARAVTAMTDEMRLETSPQTIHYASYFQWKMNQPDKEYALLKTLLSNSVRSGTSEFAAEGIERLSDLCPHPAGSGECVELVLNVRRAFPKEIPLLLAIGDFCERSGLLEEAESTLVQAQTAKPNDQEVKQRFTRLQEARRAAMGLPNQ